jgi:hypothetical protein
VTFSKLMTGAVDSDAALEPVMKLYRHIVASLTEGMCPVCATGLRPHERVGPLPPHCSDGDRFDGGCLPKCRDVACANCLSVLHVRGDFIEPAIQTRETRRAWLNSWAFLVLDLAARILD